MKTRAEGFHRWWEEEIGQGRLSAAGGGASRGARSSCSSEQLRLCDEAGLAESPGPGPDPGPGSGPGPDLKEPRTNQTDWK